MKLCLALALLVLPAVMAGNLGSVGISSPLLLWSNRGAVGQGKHVSYQVLPHMETVASELVLGALGKRPESSSLQAPVLGGSAEERSAVIVFIGNELDASHLRSFSEAVGELDAVLKDAMSSLVMPYGTSQGVSVRETVCNDLDKARVQHKAVGCSSPSADIKADVAAALAAGTDVVLVCASTEGAKDGLAAEIEQLMAAQAAVQEASVNHVIVYASQAKPISRVVADSGKRRSLLTTYTGFGDYTVCGKLCQTQVRWLEGMLAVLFLALASCAGLVCLYVLDTPTRFETPPKEAIQQQ